MHWNIETSYFCGVSTLSVINKLSSIIYKDAVFELEAFNQKNNANITEKESIVYIIKNIEILNI
jgi:hypothetical protein